jgi:hypothetical protein
VTGTIVYAGVALTVTVAMFLASEWMREPGSPAPDNPGLFAVTAGLLWPILLIAVVQCALYSTVLARLRARDRHRAAARVLNRTA